MANFEKYGFHEHAAQFHDCRSHQLGRVPGAPFCGVNAQVQDFGFVSDGTSYQEALDAILTFARQVGLAVVGSIESPIHGAAGNIEYLALLRKGTA